MPVTQLVYHSRNTLDGDAASFDAQLDGVLQVSRRNNQRDAITGYLVSDGTWFLQVLEGDHERVMGALARIRLDSRHGAVTVVDTRQIRTRSFPQWSMGGSLKTPAMRAIFRRNNLERIDPAVLTAPSILLLMMDLQDFERAQHLKRRTA